MNTSSNLAISVRQVTLTYGSPKFGNSKSSPILDSLSMQLQCGSIYGLLGPSGCGKTSLIRCILGIVPINSGDIAVFGVIPGASNSQIPGAGVGYMPQDINLYKDLTISETLDYFGALYGLTNEEIKNRSSFLVSMLNLSNQSTSLVGQLSGGQKRRVSLATALIHKPPLLILDEPTVGVDPLLRTSIWQHLVQLCQSDGLTVLITTHYIEEARGADAVGLMRDGRILVQDSPEALLQRYNLNSLEAVFLQICTNDENRSTNLDLKEKDSYSEIDYSHSSSSSSSSSSNSNLVKVEQIRSNSNKTKPSAFRKIGTMIRKNFHSLRRSPGYLVFQFLIPLAQAVLFNFCLGLDLHSLPVAIYNADQQQNLSSYFLAELSPVVIKQTLYTSQFDALESVQTGIESTALLIPSNFADCLLKKITGHATAEMLANSTIHLAVDMTNQLSVQFVQREVNRAFYKVMADSLQSMGLSRELVKSPIQMDTPIYGRLDAPFTEFLVSGRILSIVFYAGLSLTAMNLVVERTNGMTERTVITGVSYLQILISHLLTNIVILLVQSALLLVIMFVLFDIAFQGQMLWIAALTIAQAICGMAYGLFISSVSARENIVTMLTLGTYFPIFLLSGSIWPLEAMNDYFRNVAYFMPATIPNQSMRLILIRGWDIIHWEVAAGFGVTAAWIFGFIAISALVVKFKK